MRELYSSYAQEKEVLLMDGLDFYVFDFEYLKTAGGDLEFALIKLYHTSRSNLPENIQDLEEELQRQELNNQVCGGEC